MLFIYFMFTIASHKCGMLEPKFFRRIAILSSDEPSAFPVCLVSLLYVYLFAADVQRWVISKTVKDPEIKV